MSEASTAPAGAARRRLLALAALVIVIVAGLLVHATLPDSPVSDITGDALYAVAAYAGIVLLVPRARSLIVGALAAGWCIAVELFQLTGIPAQIGEVFRPAVLLLGTVFDARDLLVYVVTIVVVSAVDVGLRATHARS